MLFTYVFSYNLTAIKKIIKKYKYADFYGYVAGIRTKQEILTNKTKNKYKLFFYKISFLKDDHT